MQLWIPVHWKKIPYKHTRKHINRLQNEYVLLWIYLLVGTFKLSDTFKISLPMVTLSLNSHLVEFELKSQDVAKGEWLTHVGLDERQEKLILVRSALIHLQDYVQNTVRIQVETSCRQEKQED